MQRHLERANADLAERRPHFNERTAKTSAWRESMLRSFEN